MTYNTWYWNIAISYIQYHSNTPSHETKLRCHSVWNLWRWALARHDFHVWKLSETVPAKVSGAVQYCPVLVLLCFRLDLASVALFNFILLSQFSPNISAPHHQKTGFWCFLEVLLSRNVSAVSVLVGVVVRVAYVTNIWNKKARDNEGHRWTSCDYQVWRMHS